MDTISNSNRTRHSNIFKMLLNKLLLSRSLRELGGSRNILHNWNWGELGPRLGSRRSADGIIFQLPNSKAVKLIFSPDNSPVNEIEIGKILGDAGIAPKVYAAYESNINIHEIIQDIKSSGQNVKLNGRSYINLFQQYTTQNIYSRNFKKLYIVVLEQLHGYTLSEVIDGAPGTRNLKVSKTQLINLVTKMHELGVIHGDMHTGNIFVKVLPSGNTQLKLIDFGRSIKTPNSLTLNSANKYILSKASGVLSHAPTTNGLPSHYYINGLPTYRNKAALNKALKNIDYGGKSSTVFDRAAAASAARKAAASAARKAAASAARKAAASAARKAAASAARKAAASAARKAAASAARKVPSIGIRGSRINKLPRLRPQPLIFKKQKHKSKITLINPFNKSKKTSVNLFYNPNPRLLLIRKPIKNAIKKSEFSNVKAMVSKAFKNNPFYSNKNIRALVAANLIDENKDHLVQYISGAIRNYRIQNP